MIITGGLLALPNETEPVRADLRVADGRIVEIIRPHGNAGSGVAGASDSVVDARGMLVLPGAVDPHVHFNDPGYTDREDFYHGTAAAASGGVTTIIDMPCTSVPPVTSAANLKQKLAVIEQEAVIDYGLYGGVCGDAFEGHTFGSEAQDRIAELAPDVLGFKCYFVSGMETFPRVDHRQFEAILRMTREVGRPTLLHAEDFGYVTSAPASATASGSGARDYYESRPEAAEILAVLAACEIARITAGDLHIVHVSTGRAAQIIAAADGVTGETAPHYLAFALPDFEAIGGPLKVTPPVKREPNREELWASLAAGHLSFVASDHAPAPAAQKATGSIWTDYAGIPGSGTLLPYLYSEGYVAGRIGLDRLVALTSTSAAQRYGLDDRKGSLAPGMDADCVLMRTAADWTVRGADFLSKGHVTPFEGHRFSGRVERTIVRGTTVYDADRGITADPGYGRLLRRRQ